MKPNFYGHSLIQAQYIVSGSRCLRELLLWPEYWDEEKEDHSGAKRQEGEAN